MKTEPRACLYGRLLGESWRRVDEPVRRLHERAGGACGEGLFTVRRGGKAPARALAWLMRLPAEGEGVRVRLSVKVLEGGGELWHRTFGDRSFDTLQREGAAHVLVETAGPLELLFELREEGGALVFRQTGAALRLGRLRVPLPRALAPRVEARESGTADGRGVLVSVGASAPLAGPLLSYEGRLEVARVAGVVEVAQVAEVSGLS
jgi:hypothetical protein